MVLQGIVGFVWEKPNFKTKQKVNKYKNCLYIMRLILFNFKKSKIRIFFYKDNNNNDNILILIFH